MKRKITEKHLLAVITVIAVITTAVAIYEHRTVSEVRQQLEHGYQRAFTELADYAENIHTLLTKTMVTNDVSQMTSLSEKLLRETALAKSSLGQLPFSDSELDNTLNFLSQAGNFTYAMAKKTGSGQVLTDDELTQLSQLVDYSERFRDGLQAMEVDFMNGNMDFSEAKNKSAVFSGQQTAQVFSSGMAEIEVEFEDYPTLIYDGPFSDHVLNRTPVMTAQAAEVSPEQAAEIGKRFLKDRRLDGFEQTGETAGTIPSYLFTAYTEEGEIALEVTKNGGYVLLMADGRSRINPTLSVEEAAQKAQAFLKENGYENMKQTGYTVEGAAVQFAFAAVQDGCVMYTDLVKVKVALDNGQVCGFEAHGYLTHHTQRTVPGAAMTVEQAQAEVKPILEVRQVSAAYIPLDSGKEVFCHELVCAYKDKIFLIYLNMETGAEENILIWSEDANGSLTI